MYVQYINLRPQQPKKVLIGQNKIQYYIKLHVWHTIHVNKKKKKTEREENGI